MSEKEIRICSKCGATMQEATFDDTFSLNGEIDFDGFYCPNCVETDDADQED